MNRNLQGAMVSAAIIAGGWGCGKSAPPAAIVPTSVVVPTSAVPPPASAAPPASGVPSSIAPTIPPVASSVPAPPAGVDNLLDPASANPLAPIPGTPVSPAPPKPITDYATAAQQVESTLRAHPKDYELQINAARFYMQTNHHESAIPHLQAATRLDTHQVLPWIALGDACTLSGHFAQAAQAYNHADTLEPSNPLIARGRGQLLLLQKRFDEARQTLESSLKRHPDDVETRTALGNLYLVLNRTRKAVETLQPAVAAAPNRPDLHLLLGEAYERDLHLEAGIAEMREATRLEPRLAEAWGREGLYLINLTRYKEARPPLEQAIALEPGEGHYYWALGDSYLLESTDAANFEQAIQLYRKALELDPKNDKALYSCAMALTRRGRPGDLEESVGLLKRLIAINPIDTNAEYKLAETYRRLGRPADAAKHRARFDALFAKGRVQTRQLYAATATRDTAQAHLLLGRDALKRKNYAQASQEFQQALQRDQSLSEARNGMLQAQKNLGLIGGKSQP